MFDIDIKTRYEIGTGSKKELKIFSRCCEALNVQFMLLLLCLYVVSCVWPFATPWT